MGGEGSGRKPDVVKRLINERKANIAQSGVAGNFVLPNYGAATAQHVVDKQDEKYVDVTGDSMTGDLNMTGGDIVMTGGDIVMSQGQKIVYSENANNYITFDEDNDADNRVTIAARNAAGNKGIVEIKGQQIEFNPDNVNDDVDTFYNVGGTKTGVFTWDTSEDAFQTNDHWVFQDQAIVKLGTGLDASINYDGTDLNINPKVVGSGDLNILGNVVVTSTNTLTVGGSITTTDGNILSNNEIDLFPNNQSSIGLRITQDSTNLELTALGTSQIEFADNLLLASSDEIRFRGANQKIYSSAASTLDIEALIINLGGTILTLGTGAAAAVALTFDTSGTDGALVFDGTKDAFYLQDELFIYDKEQLQFGTGQDAGIYWNASDLIITSNNVTANDEVHIQDFDKVVVSGADLIATGDGSGLPYGSCYGNDIAFSQASAAQNTWYNVSDSDMADGQLNAVTHDGNGLLTVTNAGRYLINYHVSVDSSSAGTEVESGIEVGGSTVPNDGRDHSTIQRAGYLQAMGSSLILDLAASDTIQVAIRHTDAGTPTLGAEHVNLTAVFIGGT